MLIFNVKNIRLNKKISLSELSRRTNLSRTYLRNLEKNEVNNPTFQVLEKIAQALDVNVKELFYSELDIEKLRAELHIRINQFGINSKQALEISHIIDLLVNVNES